jgi:hypothetical protein
VKLAIALRDEGRLCIIHDDDEPQSREPRIICSLGLVDPGKVDA